MIRFECNDNYNKLRNKIIGGKVTSIWRDDSFYKGASSFPIVDFKYYTSDYSSFEKNVTSEHSKMSYHLSGYGILHNEAISSFMGESAERYTFASLYRLIYDKIINGTYLDIVQKYGHENVCDIETLNGYFLPTDVNNYLSENSKIQWLEMNSLIDLNKKVYVPLQLVVSNDGIICKNEVQFMPAAVSTGTASHENFLKSLENATIEYLQIDSFNLWWYGGLKGKEIEIDISDFLSKCFNLPDRVNQFNKNFDVKFTDISFDKDIEVIVCEVFGKQEGIPLYTVGVQGGTNLEKALYRGLMECLAVVEYNMHLPWIDNDKYLSIKKDKKTIGNLDDNVILYSKYGKPQNVINSNCYFENTQREKSYKPISSLSKLSKFACYLQITLPEFSGLNLEVTRVIIPELLPMCLPSYPPRYHKRYEKIGGIINNAPHPLA